MESHFDKRTLRYLKREYNTFAIHQLPNTQQVSKMPGFDARF
jgi:hypothetical protein